VVGLGLVGSSVALALRSAGWHVVGSDIDERRAARALEIGVVDTLGPPSDATLVVVATPVAAVAEVARRLLAERRSDPGFVVTDVGGVKGQIVDMVDDPRFVGGHPMAGSEQEGPDGASADLFVGATWVLTPTGSTDPDAFRTVRSVVASFGADAVELSPQRHDALVAIVSHLPHLAAATLMCLASDASEEHAVLLRLAAGGFRDMTRIAAGEPAIWPDIFRDNAGAVLVALDDLQERLGRARRMIAEGDRGALIELLEQARSSRRNLPARVPHPELVVECRLPVPDRPGVLAEVTTVLGELGANIRDIEIAHSAEGDRGVLVLVIDAEASERARRALVDLGYRPALARLG
jgi:prephenate dehydrogenase